MILKKIMEYINKRYKDRGTRHLMKLCIVIDSVCVLYLLADQNDGYKFS